MVRTTINHKAKIVTISLPLFCSRRKHSVDNVHVLVPIDDDCPGTLDSL